MNKFDSLWLMIQVWMCDWTIEQHNLMSVSKEVESQQIVADVCCDHGRATMQFSLHDSGLSLLDRRYSHGGVREDSLDAVEALVRLRSALQSAGRLGK